MPKPFRGIVTPLLTPLLTEDQIDTASLRRLIDHVIAGGVRGIFILGTTGEGPALSRRAQEKMVARSCEAVARRVPVLVGVTHASFEDAVALSHVASESGAAAVVSAGPIYFPVAQEQLAAYSLRFADVSPLPVYLYNMPSHTHAFFEARTVGRLFEHPNIVGLKDSSGQIMYLHELRRITASRVEFSLFVGPEEMMAECVMAGVHGGVNGGSNLFPGLYVKLYEAAMAGDLAMVAKLRARVLEISRRLYNAGTYGSSYLQGIKCAACWLGLLGPAMAAPYAPFSGREREAIREHLVELGEFDPRRSGPPHPA